MAVPNLPKNPANNAEVLDRYGNRWQFAAEENAWISKGKIVSYPTVTEDNDGLVPPELFDKLRVLEAFTDTYNLKSSFKILPGRNAYWYYFRSSDKLFRFKPEGESTLRIEVDKGRIYQLLAKNQQPGPRGSTGDVGEAGADGLAGASVCNPEGGEPTFRPSDVVGNRLDFAIFTPVPLVLGGDVELPNDKVPTIAVRLHKILVRNDAATVSDQAILGQTFAGLSTAQKFEYTRNLIIQRNLGVKQSDALCDVPLSPVVISPGELSFQAYVTIDVDPTNPTDVTVTTQPTFSIDLEATRQSIKYNQDTQIVCGSIFLNSPEVWDANGWILKSRQRGPDGIEGKAGACRIEISENLIDSTNIEATCPIVNIRYDPDRTILHTLCSNLLSEVCVSKVRLPGQSGTLSKRTALKSVFAAAQMVLDECKYVHRYIPELPDDETPELEFLHWDPQPGCVTKRNFDRHKFDWIPGTAEAPDCNASDTWFSATGVRPGKYPWEINVAKEPVEDQCCQEDFFYCPNVQDGPCPNEPPPPSPTRVAAASSLDIHDAPDLKSNPNRAITLGSKRWTVG